MNKSGLPPLQANTVRAGNKQQRMGSHPTQGQDCHIPLSSKPLNCPKLGKFCRTPCTHSCTSWEHHERHSNPGSVAVLEAELNHHCVQEPTFHSMWLRWGKAAWMEPVCASGVDSHHGLAEGRELSGEGERAWLVQRA